MFRIWRTLLFSAHQDQQALSEKLDSFQKKLDEEKALSEKTKRESVIKTEQDRSVINNLREELGRFKTKLEEIRYVKKKKKEGFYYCFKVELQAKTFLSPFHNQT